MAIGDRDMTPETAKEYLPLVKALSEGKRIQVKDGSGWYTLGQPDFTSKPSSYRIKPEKRVAYVNIYPNGMNVHHSTREDADLNASKKRSGRIRIEYEEGQFDD